MHENLSQQIATNLRQIHFGENWTASNLKDAVSNITWEEAILKVKDFNTIANLVFHVTYYVRVQLEVLNGLPLHAKDELSFNQPAITNQQDWENYLEEAWAAANALADKIEQLPESIWLTDFTGAQYGNYYRNIVGTIEHMHYHLGQITLLKKLIKESN